MAAKFIQAQKTVYRTLARFAGFMVLFAALFAVVNFVGRYFFDHTFAWAEEMCTYVCTLVVFLTFAYLETEDQQLCIDLVTSTVKNKTVLLVLYILRGIVTMIITGILIKFGFASMLSAYTLGTVTYVLHLPRYIMYCVVLFGYVCVMLGWLSVLLVNKGRKFE